MSSLRPDCETDSAGITLAGPVAGPKRMSDEQFETAVRELLVIASFHGEAADPSVQAVIEEAGNALKAMELLRRWECQCLKHAPDGVTGDELFDQHACADCHAVYFLLKKAGRR